MLPRILLSVYFNRFYGSYQCAECLHITLSAFFLGQVQGYCWSYWFKYYWRIKTIRCRNKKRPDKNSIVDYLCKSYPDYNVTSIRQKNTYLDNKNKILNKPHNGENSYYLTDHLVIIPDDSLHSMTHSWYYYFNRKLLG